MSPMLLQSLTPIELICHSDGPVLYGITLRNEGHWSARGWTLHPAENVGPEEVLLCRKALAMQLGFDPQRILVAHQVHGDTVAVVDSSAPTEPADALVTQTKGVLLCISVADCCGILLWDHDHRVVAAVHSGWRGSAHRIVQRCIEVIKHKFGIPPERLRAWLSPCASGKNYVVRSDVAQLFPEYIVQIAPDQYTFDNQAAICAQLQEAGVKQNSITYSPECTIADTRFHSYRRDGAQSGRMAVFIGMRVP